MANPTYPKVRALAVIAKFLKDHSQEERSFDWYKGAAMNLLDQLRTAGLTVADDDKDV